MGLSSGCVFLASSMFYNYLAKGCFRTFAVRHLLVAGMLALTAFSQFRIIPRMDVLRESAGEIATLPADNATRVQFEHLHVWSTDVEIGVLVLGLLTAYLISRPTS